MKGIHFALPTVARELLEKDLKAVLGFLWRENENERGESREGGEKRYVILDWR